MRHQTGDGEVGDVIGDRVGSEGTVGTEPLCRPVQRAEKGARRDRGVARRERPPGDAGRDQGADAALVAVAFGDDDRAALRRQRIHLEVRRRAFDFGDQTERVPHGELAQSIRQRPAGVALRGGQGGEQPIQRSVLTEEEDLVLAAEVVIEVGRRQIGGDGDVAHPGGGEAAAAEDLRRGAEDVHAPALGPNRTTVRKLNHRSILADLAAVHAGNGETRLFSAVSARSAVGWFLGCPT
jgi:hypothetical protein